MKKKLATVWLGGCSGCHMSLLDIDERLLEIARLADIVKCPLVDQKEFPSADITLVEGAVTTDEHLKEINIIRERTKILVSFGDCAVTGNVTALRNVWPKDQILQRSYVEAETNVEGKVPSQSIGTLLDRVRPLHEVVKVDYYLPGCPPPADLIFHVINELLNDRVPHVENGRYKYG